MIYAIMFVEIALWLIACYAWYQLGKSKGRVLAYREMSKDLHGLLDEMEELHENMHNELKDLESQLKDKNGTTRKPRNKTV